MFGQGAAAPATTSVFGQPAQSSLGSAFGQPGGTTGAFGQATQPATGSSLFGQPSQTPAATTGAFGQPTTSLFGQNTATTTPAATGGLFGQPSQPAATGTTSLFGQPSQPAATGTTGLFGQPSQPAATGTTSLFGQPSQPAATGTTSLFGQPSQPATTGTTSLFGQPSQPAATGTTSLFGQPSQPSATGTTSLFGQPSQPAATGTTSLFGQPTQQPTTSLFGQPQQQQGGGGLFGQPQQQQQGGGGLFGQPQQQQSGGLFGQPQQQQGGGLLGQSQQPAASGGFFGRPAQPQQPLGLASQSAPPPFSKSTKFNDLPDDMKKIFEQMDSHIQGRIQISKDLKQRKLGQEVTKGQEEVRTVHAELVNTTASIKSDWHFTEDLKTKANQAVEDTIVATRIVDGFRNPQGYGSYLKDHAAFPLEFFTRITSQLSERLIWYKTTVEQIERKLASVGHQTHLTPQGIASTLQAQHATFLSLANKTAILDAELQKIKAIYTQLWRTKTGSVRDPFNEQDTSRSVPVEKGLMGMSIR